MARLRRLSNVRSRTPNRQWSGIISTGPTAVPANTAILLGSFVLVDSANDVTILRTVGGIAVQSDQIAASELQLGAFAMGIVTDTALGVGASAIPDPVTDVSDDIWHVYQPILQSMSFVTAAGFENKRATYYPIDSKAKRKMDSKKAIALIVANSHASHGFEIMFGIRVLLMLRGT